MKEEMSLVKGDLHRAFTLLGCDLFGLKPCVACPVLHRAQHVRCPALLGDGWVPMEKRTVENRIEEDPEG